MALMVARFCRFYPAYSCEGVLAMRASHFFALAAAMPRIDAEEEAKALTVAHSSKPQDRLKELVSRIRDKDAGTSSTKELVLKGEASYEAEKGEIAAIRERQRRNAELMKQDREAWLKQIQNQSSTPDG